MAANPCLLPGDLFDAGLLALPTMTSVHLPSFTVIEWLGGEILYYVQEVLLIGDDGGNFCEMCWGEISLECVLERNLWAFNP